MPRSQPNSTDLVEVQTKQAGDLADRLEMLNEVVGKRQEEADTLKHELVSTQMQLTSLKRQWDQVQAHDKNQLLLWQQEQEATLGLQQNRVREAERRAQEGLQQVEQLKEEAKQHLFSLQRKEAEFASLAQDRLDTAKLHAQAEAKMTEAQELWAHAQHAQNEANGKVADAQGLAVSCEARTQQMQAAWNQIAAKTEELRLRERDLDIRERAMKQQLEPLEVRT